MNMNTTAPLEASSGTARFIRLLKSLLPVPHPANRIYKFTLKRKQTHSDSSSKSHTNLTKSSSDISELFVLYLWFSCFNKAAVNMSSDVAAVSSSHSQNFRLMKLLLCVWSYEFLFTGRIKKERTLRRQLASTASTFFHISSSRYQLSPNQL